MHVERHTKEIALALISRDFEVKEDEGCVS